MKQDNKKKQRVDLTNLKQAIADPTHYGTASNVAEHLERTQVNKFGTKGGTGFAAEDANAMHDKIRGIKVEHVGKSNTKNGADRISDGKPIQTKYFDTASKTVNDAFDSQGLYRYEGMQLEVPKDQYEKAVSLMKQKIANGKVRGVTDPEAAASIIKQGSISYKQAYNIARAGNFDSLWYDAKNGAVSSSCAFGIAFGITFARAKWSGEPTNAALTQACETAAIAFGSALLASIVTSQLLRTQVARSGTPGMKKLLESLGKSKLGKKLINRMASASAGEQLVGARARNHLAKVLRTNFISGVTTTTIMSLPDVYRAGYKGEMSWAQVSKNFVINGAGVAAGSGGWVGGAIAGAAAGAAVFPPAIPVTTFIGALLGSIAAGSAGSYLAKAGLDWVHPDDATKMLHILNDGLIEVCEEYMLTSAEVEILVAHVRGQCNEAFFRSLYASPDRRQFVRSRYRVKCETLIIHRPKAILPTADKVQRMLNEMMAEMAQKIFEATHAEYVPDFVIVGGVTGYTELVDAA